MGGGGRVAATGIALAAAVLAAVACEQALAIDGTVTVAAHQACGLTVAAGACQQCVASKCCAQATACAGDTACASYEGCLLGCGSDYTCRTQCALGYGKGTSPAVPALDQCVVSACNDACGMECGITAAPTYPDAAAGCEACMAQRLCPKTQACGSSLECEGIEHCVPSCSTMDCHSACIARDDAGLFTQLEIGLGSYCYKECGAGSFWLCVGSVAWPLAPAGQNEVDFKVVDSQSMQPVAGAQVKACNKMDVTCAVPAAQAVADASGQGTLRLPSHPAVDIGFEGYYDIESSAEMPWLVFSSSPITMSRAQFTWTVNSKNALETLAASAGVTLDPARGHILISAVDCLLSPAGGVVITASGTDSATRQFYLSGNSLAASAETDFTGIGVLLNVPPGMVTIQVTPKTLGRASSTQVIFARAGTASSVLALPTP